MDEQELAQRRKVRLEEYDYSTPGAYFVTVCTKNREHRLCSIYDVGAGFPGPCVVLTSEGEIIKSFMDKVHEKYPSVTVAERIIMPNHIHMIVRLDVCEGGPGNPAPTLGNVMGWFKYQTTKYVNAELKEPRKLWQRSYYEHVIRTREDYSECAEYILHNTEKWTSKIHNELELYL